MDPVALALVLGSAGLHAGWNLLAKRARGGFVVAWGYALVGTIALAPAGLWVLTRGDAALSPSAWGFVIVSAVLHIGYFVSLQRAYGLGDLSLVYPLARGTGPVLATIVAVTLLGERPGTLALLGAAAVAVAAFGLAGGGGAGGSPRALRGGFATGLFIATYTLWDATAVTRAGVAPLAFAWLSEAVRAALLTPFALTRRDELRRVGREALVPVIGVGVASPLAYLAVLYAFTLAPISVVAPLREVSMLITVVLGAGVLREGNVRRRFASAAAMAVGAALLALSRPA